MLPPSVNMRRSATTQRVSKNRKCYAALASSIIEPDIQVTHSLCQQKVVVRMRFNPLEHPSVYTLRIKNRQLSLLSFSIYSTGIGALSGVIPSSLTPGRVRPLCVA
jgi:hypothetical protein